LNGGATDDQFGLEKDFGANWFGRWLGKKIVQEHLGSPAAHGKGWLGYDGQGGSQQGCPFHVAKADDGHLLGYLNLLFL
jgi:hypothetical protein